MSDCLVRPVYFKAGGGPSMAYEVVDLNGNPLTPPLGLWARYEDAVAAAKRRRLTVIEEAA